MKKNKIIIIVIVFVLIIVAILFAFRNVIFDNNSCTIKSLNENLTNKEIQIEIKSINKRTIVANNIDTKQTVYKDTITQNGKYIYGIKDSKKTCEIEINNIDLSPPTGILQYNTNNIPKEVIVTVKGKDDVELDHKPYSWDDSEWTDIDTKTVNINGNYIVYIRDKAGNVASINYEINNIENIKRIENIELNLYENKKIELNEEILNELNGTVPEFILSNNEVISINSKGIITGNNIGESKVTIKFNNGNTYVWNVKVNHVKVENVVFNNSKITLKVGKSTELKPTISPANSFCINEKYTVNNDVVKVENRKVIANKAGESVITYKCDDITKNINVTVLPKVDNFSLSKTSITLKPKETANLSITNINPSNSKCDNITWSSDNTKVATVSNGQVVGVKDGTTNIQVTCDGITKTAKVTVKSIEETIKPSGSILISYESSTLKYYITKNGQYYLTYVWMADPYNQINKIDATTAEYNKTYTDEEMKSLNKAYKWKTVPEMVDAYIKNGRISSSKGLVAINGSGFSHVPYFGTTDRDGLATGWINITDSVIKRANTSGTAAQTFLAFNTDGTMQIYSSAKDEKSKKDLLNTLKNNKIKNTWSFGPTLLQNSEVKTARTDINKRNGLCQVNRNNFIIFTGTSRNGYSYTQEAEIFKSLGCKTAYGLDGGDSVSLVYKKNGQTKSTVQYCNDTYGGSRSSSTTHCRYIVEGIYFVEK